MISDQQHPTPDSLGVRVIERLRKASQETESSALEIGKLLSEIADIATEDVSQVQQRFGVKTNGGEAGLAESSRSGMKFVAGYVATIREFLERQLEFADAANAACESVNQSANAVTELMERSQVLSLNIQIEAARIGDQGNAFTCIGNEMKNFSREVREENHRIVEALSCLSTSLPVIRQEMTDMDVETVEFTEHLEAQRESLEEDTRALSRSLHESLEHTEVKNQHILRCSQSMLSALQYQDPVSKELGTAQDEVRRMQAVLDEHHLSAETSDESSAHLVASTTESDPGEVVLF